MLLSPSKKHAMYKHPREGLCLFGQSPFYRGPGAGDAHAPERRPMRSRLALHPDWPGLAPAGTGASFEDSRET